MKKVLRNLLMMSLISSTVFMFSCGEDDVETPAPVAAPTISLSGDLSSMESFEVGDSIGLNVSFTAAGEFSGFNYQLTINKDSTDEQVQSKVFNAPSDLGYGNAEVSGMFALTIFEAVPAELVGKTVSVYMEIVDKEEQIASRTWTFDVFEGINTYTAVLLGAQGNAAEGFYNADENVLYKYSEARDASTVTSSPVDLAYYYGTSNKNTIAAIDDAGLNSVYSAVSLPIDGIFGTKNSTRFVKLTGVDFAAVVNSTQLTSAASFESTTSGASSVTGLVQDDVIAFQLDADRGAKFGLIKVASINDTNGNGTITIEVKIGK